MPKNKFIIGIDEVGRGALAGPLLVAAVMVPKNLRIRSCKLAKLRDSKKLTKIQREVWFKRLKGHPKIIYSIARVSPAVIDRINIAKAANRAALRALRRLIGEGRLIHKTSIYLDGGLYLDQREKARIFSFNSRFASRGRTSTLIRGDEKINAIKIASVIAKVTRDRYMIKLHKKNPKYNFSKHKGYGTKEHKRAIKEHGPSEVHRLTFIKKYIRINPKH